MVKVVLASRTGLLSYLKYFFGNYVVDSRDLTNRHWTVLVILFLHSESRSAMSSKEEPPEMQVNL